MDRKEYTVQYIHGTELGKYYIGRRSIYQTGMYEVRRFVSEESYEAFLDKISKIETPSNWADGRVPGMLHMAAKELYMTTLGLTFDPKSLIN